MMQSPTSVNTYLQCHRKYYNKYIKRIREKETPEMLVGTLTHEILAEFVSGKDYSRERLMTIFESKRNGNKSSLLKSQHYGEIKTMLENWFESICVKVDGKFLKNYFEGVKTELKLKSDEYNVCGVLDLFNEDKGYIVEYKTSSKDMIKPEYKLQLGIYALLFYEKFKRLPTKLSINFLKHGIKDVPLTAELVNEAKRVCKLVKLKTLSRDVEDYPCKKSSLCRLGWCVGDVF